MMPQSAMNYFQAPTIGGAPNIGNRIGAVNSIASGPSTVIRNVLERARAWTDQQNAHANALELAKIQHPDGGAGGILDLTQGVTAPEGYVSVPEYTVDSSGRRVLKTSKMLKAQSPLDKMLINVQKQMEDARNNPQAVKKPGLSMPWDKPAAQSADLAEMSKIAAELRAIRMAQGVQGSSDAALSQ
jgi:hypothetical protein